MKAEEILVEQGDQRFAGMAWGPENGQRVLALHGWLDNAASFSRLAPLLSGCRVIALDLPGHGHSPHRRGEAYHFVDYVADVATAADGLGWETFSLLGHSLGAGIATLFAGSFTQRVQSLVLIEGVGALTATAADMPAAVRAHWTRAKALAGKRAPNYVSFDDAIKARAAGGAGIPVEAAQILCSRGLVKKGNYWVWRNDAYLTLPSPQRLTEEQVLAFTAAIEAPTLVIRANQGLDFNQQKYAGRLATIRALNVVEIDGGHHLHLEDAAGNVAAAILAHFS